MTDKTIWRKPKDEMPTPNISVLGAWNELNRNFYDVCHFDEVDQEWVLGSPFCGDSPTSRHQAETEAPDLWCKIHWPGEQGYMTRQQFDMDFIQAKIDLNEKSPLVLITVSQ